MNEINIAQKQVIYDLNTEYCSESVGKNYTAQITGIKESDGKVTIRPDQGKGYDEVFIFDHSDPDRVIAVARLIMAFAQTIKNNNNSRQLGGEE